MALYFKPDLKFANTMAPFKLWEATKEDSKTHDLLRYMSYWVAGTKLIFIALLVVILLFGSNEIKLFSLIVLILSILSYYWKLAPLIKKMDDQYLIDPPGYSQTLNMMIAIFVLILSTAGVLHIWLGF